MKNNWLKYLVVAALLINSGTLILFWLKRPLNDNRPPRPLQILEKELQLDNKQLDTYEILKKQHHRSNDSLLQLMAEKRRMLYSSKSIAVDSTIHEIGLIQQEIESITYHHFEDLRKICTPKQQAKLDNLLLGAVQHLLMPKDRRNPPPPRRD